MHRLGELVQKRRLTTRKGGGELAEAGALYTYAGRLSRISLIVRRCISSPEPFQWIWRESFEQGRRLAGATASWVGHYFVHQNSQREGRLEGRMILVAKKDSRKKVFFRVTLPESKVNPQFKRWMRQFLSFWSRFPCRNLTSCLFEWFILEKNFSSHFITNVLLESCISVKLLSNFSLFPYTNVSFTRAHIWVDQICIHLSRTTANKGTTLRLLAYPWFTGPVVLEFELVLKRSGLVAWHNQTMT